MKRKIISVLLAAAMLSSLLAGCGGPDGGGKSEALTLSPETTSVTTSDGITVVVGDYVLDGETELTVTKQPAEENKEEGYKIEAYDFTLGELHELDDFITIRIPYDTTYCDEGQDPARCVGAKYKNESTGVWEDVLFEVDAEAGELVIYTDHLSYYGAFYVKNEGKRSAYIADVLGYVPYMSSDETLSLARGIAADDPGTMRKLIAFGGEASNKMFDYADRLDNAINIATLGDVPDWLSTEIPETNQTLFSAIGYAATCVNLMKIGIDDSLGGGADKGEVLNLIRDVGSKVTTYWADAFTTAGSGALSVGMGGVLIIDKMLTAFAEEAQATKLEDMGFIYYHYNEGFTGFGHKPMTAKDWRQRVIQVLDKHPEDPEIAVAALEAGFNEYASQFFKLSLEQMNEVAADTPGVTVKRVPSLTEDEQQTLIDGYIAHLKDKTMPAVLKSVENYMVRKAEQSYITAMNAVRDFYNTKISITIKENIPEGQSSQYEGYQFRFAPLSETAAKGSWTGKWNKSGSVTSSATLIGFMTAGLPHTVEFFAPDADLNTAEPEFTVPFVISAPDILIEFGGAPGGISGKYDMELSYEGFGPKDSVTAVVLLHEDNTMEIGFTPHIVMAGGSTRYVDPDLNEGRSVYLVGRYDPDTNTFTGMGEVRFGQIKIGETELPAPTAGMMGYGVYWDLLDTVITFDEKTGTASGVRGSELEGTELFVRITMQEKK